MKKDVSFSLLPNSFIDLEISSSLILSGLGTKDSPFDKRLISFCSKVLEERLTMLWDFFVSRGISLNGKANAGEWHWQWWESSGSGPSQL